MSCAGRSRERPVSIGDPRPLAGIPGDLFETASAGELVTAPATVGEQAGLEALNQDPAAAIDGPVAVRARQSEVRPLLFDEPHDLVRIHEL